MPLFGGLTARSPPIKYAPIGVAMPAAREGLRLSRSNAGQPFGHLLSSEPRLRRHVEGPAVRRGLPRHPCQRRWPALNRQDTDGCGPWLRRPVGWSKSPLRWLMPAQVRDEQKLHPRRFLAVWWPERDKAADRRRHRAGGGIRCETIFSARSGDAAPAAYAPAQRLGSSKA